MLKRDILFQKNVKFKFQTVKLLNNIFNIKSHHHVRWFAMVLLLFIFQILIFPSCKTCKCPAYSQTVIQNTSGTIDNKLNRAFLPILTEIS